MNAVQQNESPGPVSSQCFHSVGMPLRHSHFVDICVAAVLVLATVVYGVMFVDFSITPFEDAAILMRYARNVADGNGVRWNADEAPVDGATDFLFMLAVAALAKTGIDVGIAVRVLGYAAHLASVALVYLFLRTGLMTGRTSAIVTSAYLAVGPGLRYVAAYFGTPVFALSVCIAWCIALAALRRETPPTAVASAALAFAGLVAGLIRPEGVILSAFILLALIVRFGVRNSLQAIAVFAVVLGLLGGIYFAWHWHYFGHPLPNPFYRKGGFVPASLIHSAHKSFYLCLPFLLPFVPVLFDPARLRRNAAVIIPIAGFVAIWVLLSNEMNFGARFQYAVLPMVLCAWPMPAQGIMERIRPRVVCPSARVATAILLILVSACAVVYQHNRSRKTTYARDGRYYAAMALHKYADRDYTLATSEAGLLPYFSEWRTVDTWGLNDSWITHHGGVTHEYLDRYRPEVIMAYVKDMATSHQGNQNDAFRRMAETVVAYAEARDYFLAASYGPSAGHAHRYYVRRDCPDAESIVDEIRNLDYRWFENGARCRNHAILAYNERPD